MADNLDKNKDQEQERQKEERESAGEADGSRDIGNQIKRPSFTKRPSETGISIPLYRTNRL